MVQSVLKLGPLNERKQETHIGDTPIFYRTHGYGRNTVPPILAAWAFQLIEETSGTDAEAVPLSHTGVSKNRGTPKWMVYNGKPY